MRLLQDQVVASEHSTALDLGRRPRTDSTVDRVQLSALRLLQHDERLGTIDPCIAIAIPQFIDELNDSWPAG